MTLFIVHLRLNNAFRLKRITQFLFSLQFPPEIVKFYKNLFFLFVFFLFFWNGINVLFSCLRIAYFSLHLRFRTGNFRSLTSQYMLCLWKRVRFHFQIYIFLGLGSMKLLLTLLRLRLLLLILYVIIFLMFFDDFFIASIENEINLSYTTYLIWGLWRISCCGTMTSKTKDSSQKLDELCLIDNKQLKS